MLNNNINELSLKKLRDDYFDQVISINDYREERKKLFNLMEFQLNGRHNTSINSKVLLFSGQKEDINIFTS